MGTRWLSSPRLNAIHEFHECSVRSQIEEAKLLHVNSSLVYSAVETSRKRLTRSLLKLIEICVVESLRHQRHFRMKYAEDINSDSLEECLISTANRVLDLSSTDRSLTAVRPIARTFLVTLARVQTHVATLVEATEQQSNSPCQKQSAALNGTKGIRSRRNSFPPHLPFFVEAATPEADDINRSTDRRPQCMKVSRPLLSTASLPLLRLEESSGPTEPSCSCDPNQMGDSMTALIELLIEVDHDMAIFEFALVSSISRRMRTEAEAFAVQEVAVLFSETLAWALAVGLVDARQVSERDPRLFVALPRLALLVGCLLLPDSPIGPNRLNAGARPPFMFVESTRELTYLARQLAVLRADQLWRLACWTSPFGISEAETRHVDAATAAAAATGAGDEAMKLPPTQPCSLVFGWNTYGLHCIYKCIAAVAEALSANHPSECRDVLQLAIELHDTSSSPCRPDAPTADADSVSPESEALDLQPICPLDDEAARGCLHEGRIRSIRLSDLFDWHAVVSSCVSQRPFAELFRPHGRRTPTPPLPRPSEGHVEVGFDVVAALDEEEDAKSLQHFPVKKAARTPTPPSSELTNNGATSRSLLLALLRSAPIEGTRPADPPNPLYPLAPWQPDHFVAVDSVVDADADDSEDDDAAEETLDDADTREARRWRSGAPRVGRECARCKSRFRALLRRRHHCRRCGHIFCAACCSEKAPVAALFSLKSSRRASTDGTADPSSINGAVVSVRVCVECAEFVRSGLAEALDQVVIST